MRSLRNILIALLVSVGLLLTAATPAMATGSTVTYSSSPTGGSSGVWVVNGGTTTIYPGQARTGITSMKVRPGQVVWWRYQGSLTRHETANHSTTTMMYVTVTAATLIMGSTYF